LRATLLDTDSLSYFLNGDNKVTERIQEYLTIYDRLIFCEITYFEILAGLEYKEAQKQIIDFELFTSKCTLLKLTEESIKISAKIY
jgi:tRNA(fMet)-specific endonuclease VapC